MGMVFVTGGSRGIGRAVCTAFARTGRDVAFCYSRDEDGARETVRQIEREGVGVLSLRADVSDESAVSVVSALTEISRTVSRVSARSDFSSGGGSFGGGDAGSGGGAGGW